MSLGGQPVIRPSGVTLPLCVAMTYGEPMVGSRVPLVALPQSARARDSRRPPPTDASVTIWADARMVNALAYGLWQTGLLRALAQAPSVTVALGEDLEKLDLSARELDPRLPPVLDLGTRSTDELWFRLENMQIGTTRARKVMARPLSGWRGSSSTSPRFASTPSTTRRASGPRPMSPWRFRRETDPPTPALSPGHARARGEPQRGRPSAGDGAAPSPIARPMPAGPTVEQGPLHTSVPLPPLEAADEPPPWREPLQAPQSPAPRIAPLPPRAQGDAKTTPSTQSRALLFTLLGVGAVTGLGGYAGWQLAATRSATPAPAPLVLPTEPAPPPAEPTRVASAPDDEETGVTAAPHTRRSKTGRDSGQDRSLDRPTLIGRALHRSPNFMVPIAEIAVKRSLEPPGILNPGR